MSSRTVAVVLTAQVQNYVSEMRAAQRHTTEVERAARSATEQFRAHNEALTKVGVAIGAVGATAAVGLGVAVKAAAEYGAKMAELRTLSGATVNEMAKLSDAAMKQGTAFGFSATQVADAEIELTKAGRSTSQMLNGDLKGALALAAAGQIDVAKATQIGVSALTQFQKSGATIPQVADALAAGSAKALGSVEDLGMALQQSGLVASQMGLDLDDTVGTLSAFAQAGLLGSDAGTSFKTMLLSLQSPSMQAKAALDEYNISAYDAQGNFVGIADLAGQLKSAFAGVDQASRDAALSTIFGSDAIRAANVLYTQGKTGIEDWTAAVDDTGYASAQAAGKLGSLQGDVQKLSAAWQTDLVKAGTSAAGAFRGIIQAATGVVEGLGKLDTGAMTVVTTAVGLVAVVGLVGGAALAVIPKIIGFRAALTELNISAAVAARTFAKGAGLTIGLTLLTAGLAGAAVQGQATAQQIALTGESARKSFGDLDKLFNNGSIGQGAATLKEALRIEGLESAGNKIASVGGILSVFSDGVRKNEGAFDAIGQQLAGLAQQDYGKASQSFAGLVTKYKLGAEETKKLLDLMPAYRDELTHQAEAAHVSASDANLLQIAQGKGAVSVKVLAAAQAAASRSAAAQAEAIAGLRGEAKTAQGSIEDLANTIAGFGSATLDARAAQRDFRKAVQDAKDALKDGKKSDDDKQEALDGIARAGIASAAALAKVPGGTKKAEAAMRDARSAFIDAEVAMGKSRTAAERLADKLGLIPANVKAAVAVSGIGAAEAKLGDLQGRINTLVNGHYVANVNFALSGSAVTGPVSKGADVIKRAGGGGVYGSGPKGVDSVYAILAPGEHVLTAAEVDRMGGQSAVSMFRADLMQAFAKGGPVNAIGQQSAAEAKAQAAADAAQASVIAAKKRADAAQADADRAQKRYEDIDGTKANRAAKKAAKGAVDAAKREAENAAKRVETLRDRRDKARDDVKNAADAAAQLRLDREDFVSGERRGGQDPLGYVDQLRQMSRDSNYSAADRARFKAQANDAEKQITAQMRSQDEYTKKIAASTKVLDEQKDALAVNKQTLDDATSSLESLKSTAAGFAAGISSAISGQYQASSAVTAAMKDSTADSGWFERDGIRYAQTTVVKGDEGGATTLGTVDDYYAKSANDTGAFTSQLQQLVGRNVDRKLIAEIAGYGPDKGGAIARVLLAANDGDFQRINNNFAATLVNSDRAGALLSDYTYGSKINDAQGVVDGAQSAYATQQAIVASQEATIKAQQAAADQITEALTGQGDSLKNTIGRAFGLKGYASGTGSATAGIHWVGEDGPELLGFGGGEAILNAAASRQWVRGTGSAQAGAPSVTVQAPQVVFPDTITVQDASGFELRMRVVAQQEIAADAAHDAVLMMGGPA